MSTIEFRTDWDSPPNPTYDLWTITNASEIVPGVLTPLLASWVANAEVEVVLVVLTVTVVVVCPRESVGGSRRTAKVNRHASRWTLHSSFGGVSIPVVPAIWA